MKYNMFVFTTSHDEANFYKCKYTTMKSKIDIESYMVIMMRMMRGALRCNVLLHETLDCCRCNYASFLLHISKMALSTLIQIKMTFRYLHVYLFRWNYSLRIPINKYKAFFVDSNLSYKIRIERLNQQFTITNVLCICFLRN